MSSGSLPSQQCPTPGAHGVSSMPWAIPGQGWSHGVSPNPGPPPAPPPPGYAPPSAPPPAYGPPPALPPGYGTCPAPAGYGAPPVPVPGNGPTASASGYMPPPPTPAHAPPPPPPPGYGPPAPPPPHPGYAPSPPPPSGGQHPSPLGYGPWPASSSSTPPPPPSLAQTPRPVGGPPLPPLPPPSSDRGPVPLVVPPSRPPRAPRPEFCPPRPDFGPMQPFFDAWSQAFAQFSDTQWESQSASQGARSRVRSRSRSRSSRAEPFKRLVRKMRQSIQEKSLPEAISAALEIVEMGNKKPPLDLLRQLMEAAAATPGPEVFAQALECCARGKLELGLVEYARLLGKLMSRDASLAQCRMVLNMALPRDSKPVPLIPEKLKPEEAQAAFRDLYTQAAQTGGSKNPDAQAPGKGGSGTLELEQEDEYQEQDIIDSDEESGEEFSDLHGALEFRACEVIPELNGTYSAEPAQPDILHNDRPVYAKTRDDATSGKGFDDVFAYFKENLDAPWRTGWYISSDIEGDEMLAYNPAETQYPPRRGWRFFGSNDKRPTPDSGYFCVPGKPAESEEAKAINEAAQADEAQEALSKVDLSNLMGIVRDARRPEIAAYFCHFTALLHLERLTELSVFRRRLLRHPVERLVSMGWALQDLEVSGVFGRQQRRGALEGWKDEGSEFVGFWLPKWVDWDRLRIKKGECVILSYSDPLKDRVCEGTVESIDWKKIVINLSCAVPDGARDRRWRIDVSANRIVYERQFNALLKIAKTEKLDPLCGLVAMSGVGQVDSWAIQSNSKRRSNVPPWKSKLPEGQAHEDDDKEEKDREADAQKAAPNKPQWPAEIAAQPPLSDQPYDAAAYRAKAQEIVATAENLNTSQKSAIAEAAVRRCSIVQGPPGTGKTHVSVELIRIWAKVLGLSPLLATSDSNVAVDNIAEGLNRAGVRAVRLGRPEKVREHLEDISLDNILRKRKEEKQAKLEEKKAAALEAQRIEKQQASEARREARREALYNDDVPPEMVEELLADTASPDEIAGEADNVADDPDTKNADEDAAQTEVNEEEGMKKLHNERKKQRQEDFAERKRILQGADVICCTTISSGGGILSDFNFKGILIDEVAQATEISAIVPLVMRGASRLVLCGDHCQLPPSVLSREAQLRGLSLSLYSRLAQNGVTPFFLDTQYRCHPRLAEFSARCFYQGCLHSGISESQRPLPSGVDWPNPDVPIAFFEVGANETVEGESKANPEEVKQVVQLVLQVLQDGELGADEIGVVTPYMAQVRALRKAIRERLQESDRRLLEIASVDNFQGREKDLIIFSAVRCNRQGNVGFLADWRRLNVMLTRARRGLVVFGTAATLRHDCYWQQWLEWAHELKATSAAPKKRAGRLQKKTERMAVPDWKDAWEEPYAENTKRRPTSKSVHAPKSPTEPPPAHLRPTTTTARPTPSSSVRAAINPQAKPTTKAQPWKTSPKAKPRPKTKTKSALKTSSKARAQPTRKQQQEPSPSPQRPTNPYLDFESTYPDGSSPAAEELDESDGWEGDDDSAGDGDSYASDGLWNLLESSDQKSPPWRPSARLTATAKSKPAPVDASDESDGSDDAVPPWRRDKKSRFE
eukprot:TRINITY_DN23438_c0_g1_i1.p1 TRINITY_DN23438_c0_g1~~TRINITY_DN23438_c0_g1_i1.p1  ORF type:complete len:1595 (-),score=274.71 TRINITY_DN23438_c0_g1_i1:10-4794(-)